MEHPEKMEALDLPLRVFGALFSLVTKLEALGDSGRYLGELTVKQWFLLANLGTFFESPPTIGQLAAHMGTSHQNVKAIASLLEKKGFVRLQKDASDGRALRVVPSGKSIGSQELVEKQYQFVKDLWSPLSQSELAQLDSVLFRLVLQTEQMARTDSAAPKQKRRIE